MVPPILFIDEKEVKDDNGIKLGYRFDTLKNELSDCLDIIEFIGDLDVRYVKIPYTDDEYSCEPNPYIEFRKIIFIHVSNDDPAYPAPVVRALKRLYPEITFVQFSGERSLKLHLRDLRFARKRHIYSEEGDINGFPLAIRFYKKYNEFHPRIIAYGHDAFTLIQENVEKCFKEQKRIIYNKETLTKHRFNSKFDDIMEFAGLSEERIMKGKELISSINNPSEYFSIIEKYVDKITNECKHNNKNLMSL